MVVCVCVCVGEGDRLKAAAGSASAFNFPPHSPRGVPRMAGGPPSRQGTGNSGGDAEHKEGQKNTTTIILLDAGLDNPVALSPLQIRKQKPRADRSLPEDTQPVTQQLGLVARLVCRAGFQGAHSWAWISKQGTPGAAW